MPAFDVRSPLPLTRMNPVYPGVFGIAGTSTETGLRQHCTGVVIYVDPNILGVSDLRPGTDALFPLASVGTALQKVEPYRGDEIRVMANDGWTYGSGAEYATAISESVTVNVPGVKITGVCPSGALGPVWYPAADGETAITVNALDVLIEGFCFTERPGSGGAETAIAAEWDGVTLWGENISVRNCFFGDGLTTGIDLEYCWNCFIENNVFQHVVGAAVYADPGGSGIGYTRFLNNWFQDCGDALSIAGATDCLIQRNVLHNSAAQAGAAATNEGILTSGGSSNAICENWFSCLLPVAAPGDFNDFNTPSATDSWIANYCTNGLVTLPPT